MTGPGPAGHRRPSATGPLLLGAFTLVLLVGGLGAWSVVARLAGAVVAPGRLEVSQSHPVVQHPDGGVVEAVLVAEGQRVAAGDVLLRLDGSALRSEQAIVLAQLLELAARRARLEAQRADASAPTYPEPLVAVAAERGEVAEMIAGQTRLFDRQADALRQARDLRRIRVAQIESQMAGLRAQQAAHETETALLLDEIATQRDLLDRGLIEAGRLSVLERDLARLRGAGGELAAALAEASGRITETRIEIAAIVTQSREKAELELRDVVARQSELAERERALAERIGRLELRAPASGLVLGLAVTTPRSVIRPAEALLQIVPQDRPLLVAARVAATDIDEVHPGQIVRLVFSSLSPRNMPEVGGRVSRISADALADDRTGIAYFRTEIAIDPGSLTPAGGARIVPGMPVEAYLGTSEQAPLAYLLKPFADYFRGALRES
jgi:HlyD family secretion protein